VPTFVNCWRCIICSGGAGSQAPQGRQQCVLPLSHHLLGGRWIPSAPGSAAVRCCCQRRKTSFSCARLSHFYVAVIKIQRKCIPTVRFSEHCGSQTIAAFITVQLDHNLRKTSSGPSLTVSVTRLLGSRTGEPALPPALCLNVCCAHRALHVSLVGRPARH